MNKKYDVLCSLDAASGDTRGVYEYADCEIEMKHA